jgi:hypothetical protein
MRISDELDFYSDFIVDTPLCKVFREYEIEPKMAKYLPQLHNFEIVCVCDDSGSMNTTVDGTDRTRWDELCSIIKIIVRIGVIFDSNGVDIYFLNRSPILGVKDPTVIGQAFQIPPSGFTPLVPILNEIFQSQLPRCGSDKKLLVFVATDGQPTDKDNKTNVPELEHLMLEKRQPDTTYVSFIVCTDDAASVKYLRKWDKTMQHVDVTDDFRTERDIIRRCKKQKDYPFSFGDYVVKALVGAIVPEIDRLDE